MKLLVSLTFLMLCCLFVYVEAGAKRRRKSRKSDSGEDSANGKSKKEASLEDVKKIPDMFKNWDKDGDGFLDKKEFKSMDPDDKMLGNTFNEVYEQIDRDKDGKVSPREFQKYAETVLKADSNSGKGSARGESKRAASDASAGKMTTKWFKQLDKDGNGFLNEKEASKIVRDGSMTGDGFHELYTSMDKNKDGKLSEDELRVGMERVQEAKKETPTSSAASSSREEDEEDEEEEEEKPMTKEEKKAKKKREKEKRKERAEKERKEKEKREKKKKKDEKKNSDPSGLEFIKSAVEKNDYSSSLNRMAFGMGGIPTLEL